MFTKRFTILGAGYMLSGRAETDAPLAKHGMTQGIDGHTLIVQKTTNGITLHNIATPANRSTMPVARAITPARKEQSQHTLPLPLHVPG